ncbi:AsmA family protein [Salidesulfovibrio onnuriiensis]|uniref:AsmA family protein n=1 Tax=Salidesulfovibrio onnuriiensis TaxID=2583823 RepID=UPI0011CB830D|nr:AsmA family protein [Salidesulfovibrio onnuriiensis]
MLKKILISISAILFVCIGSVAGALLWASYYVDSPQFRNDLFASLSRITGREVRLNGELDVAVYPWFGLRAYDVTVANEPEFGDEPYISYREVAFGVEVLPLLARELVVSEILIDGMEIRLIRNADSEVNWDYYQGVSAASETPFFSYFKSIFIAGVNVHDAVLSFDDGELDENIRLHGLSARIGAFIPGESAGFDVDGIFERVKGELSVELHVSGILNTDLFSRSSMFDETSVELLIRGGGLPEQETARLVADIDYDKTDDDFRFENVHARVFDVDVSGSGAVEDVLSDWKLSGEVTTEVFSPISILKRLDVKRPLDKVRGLTKAKCKAVVSATASSIVFPKVVMLMDDTQLSGNATVELQTSPRVAFDVSATRLDLDRYLPLFETGTPFIWDDYSLPFWGGLRASGNAVVNEFRVLGTDFNNVKATLVAEKGALKASARAGLYGGLLGADLAMNIDRRKDDPALWTSLKAQIKSAKFESIPYASGDWGKLEGPVDMGLSLLLNQDSCQAQARSIEALRNMRLDLDINSPGGSLKLKKSDEAFQFDRLRMQVKATPMPSNKGDYLFNTQATFRAEQKRSSHYGVLSWSGPLALNKDFNMVSSSGGGWNLESAGWLLPGLDDVVTAKGQAGFTPNMRRLTIKDAELKALGATLTTSFASENPLEDSRILDGSFSLYGFNPEAVIAKYGVNVYEMEDESVFDFLTAHADFRYANSRLFLSRLKAQLDDTSIEGKLDTTMTNPPEFNVALKLGRVDLDRYLTPDKKPDLKKLRAGIDEDAPPVAMPLDFLRWLTVQGSLWVEEFILQDIKVQKLSGAVDARAGKIKADNLSGDFYGGSLKGSLNGVVHAKELESSLKLSLHDFEVGPMLQDLVEREYVQGRTNMDIDINGRGASDDDIVANLNGTIDLSVGKGSYKFMNWDAKVDPRKIAQGEPDPRTQRTAFNSVTSKWVIKDGYFDMKQFHLDGPLMTGTGYGGFSPAEESIDLNFKADFVAVPSVTVRIVGHIQDPEVKVPKGKIVTDTLQNIINIPQKSLRFLRDLFF